MYTKLILMLLLLGNLMSQTFVEGNVSGVWELQGNPYLLTADCVVGFGDTLIIQDGVRIDLDSLFEFRVQGVLFATGALFQNGGSVRGDNGQLNIDNCAFIGLDEGIKIISGSARFHGCRIDGTAETGISFSNVDSSFIRYSNISNSGDYGICKSSK